MTMFFVLPSSCHLTMKITESIAELQHDGFVVVAELVQPSAIFADLVNVNCRISERESIGVDEGAVDPWPAIRECQKTVGYDNYCVLYNIIAVERRCK